MLKMYEGAVANIFDILKEGIMSFVYNQNWRSFIKTCF